MNKNECETCGVEIFFATYHGGGKWMHAARYDEDNNLIQHNHHARKAFVSTGEFAWSEDEGVKA